MLTYEKCIELRQTGYPFIITPMRKFPIYLFGIEEQGKILRMNEREVYVDFGTDNICYIPTLEELIEECGGSFQSLVQIQTGEWKATALLLTLDASLGIPMVVGTKQIDAKGEGSAEAVANLYLVINKTDANS